MTERATNKNKHRPACTRKVTLIIRYTLNTATTVTFRITGRVPGREFAGRCVTQTGKNRHHKKCTRHVTLSGPTARASRPGTNRLVVARKLAPGNYALTAAPTSGAPQRITFKIVP